MIRRADPPSFGRSERRSLVQDVATSRLETLVRRRLELPTFLRTEVTLHNNRAIIQSVAFLECLDAQCLAKVCLKLVLTRVAPGAIVVREGEVGNDLYFIANGTIVLSITAPPCVAADLDIEPRVGFARLSLTADPLTDYLAHLPQLGVRGRGGVDELEHALAHGDGVG